MAEILLQGFKRFRKDTYEGTFPLMKQLVKEGQSPEYFIISCIDSRTNPGTIFRSAPGTFLAHKSMGALVRPYRKGTALAATLEFALSYNKVREIIIMGHTGCGAVNALINGIEGDEISNFLNTAKADLRKAKIEHKQEHSCSDFSRIAEEKIIISSSQNLRTYPSVIKALAENRLKIRPWLFEMTNGNIFEYDEQSRHFRNITNFESADNTRKMEARA